MPHKLFGQSQRQYEQFNIFELLTYYRCDMSSLGNYRGSTSYWSFSVIVDALLAI